MSGVSRNLVLIRTSVRERGKEMEVSKARYMARRIGILAVLGFAIAGFASGQVAGASSAKASVSHYVVHSGDTLWAIAAVQAPHGDQADYVARLVDLNQLQTSKLLPGQQLLLPSN